MKTNFLLPNYWKKYGWALFGLGLSMILWSVINNIFDLNLYLNLEIPIFGYTSENFKEISEGFLVNNSFWGWRKANIILTLINLFSIIGLLIIYFSKDKIEDELTSKMRLDSLAWAVILNSILALIALLNLTIFFGLLQVLELNLVSILLIASLRYNYLKLRFKKRGMSIFNKKNRYLISHNFIYLGWALLLFGIIAHILDTIFYGYLDILVNKSPNFDLKNIILFVDRTKNQYPLLTKGYIEILKPTLIISSVIGPLLLVFSKEKIEDEYISSLRLKALSLSVLVHYAYILIANFLVWGMEFLSIMTYAMYTPLVFYILYFNYLKFKMKRSLSNDHNIEGLCI
jgi:hypothetical protein